MLAVAPFFCFPLLLSGLRRLSRRPSPPAKEQRVSCALHLAHAGSYHSSQDIYRALRNYLKHEWLRKAGESHDSVPKRRAAESGGSLVPVFDSKTCGGHKLSTVPKQVCGVGVGVGGGGRGGIPQATFC